MKPSPKGSLGKVVTIGIVLAFVVIASVIFLHILSNKASEEAPNGSINLVSYIDGVETIGTEPLERVSLNCEIDTSACQDVVSAFETSVEAEECQKGKESIKISGYFNTKLRREIYSGCPGYLEISRVFRKNIETS